MSREKAVAARLGHSSVRMMDQVYVELYEETGRISSLWPFLDTSTLMLITRFYEIWRGTDSESYDPAESLILAQRWIRDTTNEEKLNHWEGMKHQGQLPEETYLAMGGASRSASTGPGGVGAAGSWGAGSSPGTSGSATPRRS